MDGARVLVTGACGFIGSHLTRALRRRGAYVVALDRSAPAGRRDNIGANEFVEIDLGSDNTAQRLRQLGSFDLCFHLAAVKYNQTGEAAVEIIRSNVLGTAQLLLFLGEINCPRVVFASSLYAYGRVAGPALHEEESPTPTTFYGDSKWQGERLCALASEKFGIRYCALRYMFVYGPGQLPKFGYPSVINKGFSRILSGQRPVIFGDGEQVLDYIYVDDVVDATIQASALGLGKSVINVGSGKGVSVRKLTEHICTIAGVKHLYDSGPADWTHNTCRVANIQKATTLLGWKPAVSLEEGLIRTFEDIRVHHGT